MPITNVTIHFVCLVHARFFFDFIYIYTAPKHTARTFTELSGR